MKTKTTLLLLILLAISSSLHGLVNLGEAGTINFSLSSDLTYDSEIRSRATSQSDTILSLRPAFVYSRPSKNVTLSASVGAMIQRYFEFQEYDDEGFFFDLNISPNADIDKSRFSFSGDILLNSETRSDEQIGDIITTYNYGVSGEITYHPNRNYVIISNASWRREDPKSNTYYKFDRFGAGLNLQVPLREDMSWNIGAGLEKVQSDRNTRSDSNIWTYSTGFTGVVLTKLEGSLAAGLQQRKFDSGGDDTSPYFSANLGWAIDDSTNLNLSASTSMGTTLNDYSTERTSLSLSLGRQLNRRMSASVGIGYQLSNYKVVNISSREDESYSANASVSYRLTDWGSVGVFAFYSEQASGDSSFEYDRYRVGIRFSGTW